MALKGVLTQEEHEALSEPLKAEYRQGEDELFYLDVIEHNGWGFQDIGGLKNTAKERKKERDQFKRELDDLKRKYDGLKPEDKKELEDLREKLSEMEGWSPDEQVQAKIKSIQDDAERRISALKSTSDQKYREAEDGFNKERSKLRSSLLNKDLEDHLRRVCKKNKMDFDALRPHAKEAIRSEYVDGRCVHTVVDEDGEPRMSGKPGNSGEMDIDELVDSVLRQRFPSMVTIKPATGGGSASSAAGGGRGRQNQTVDPDLPPKQRIAEWRRQNASAGQ